MDDELFLKASELIFKKYFIGSESWDFEMEIRRIHYAHKVKKLYFVLLQAKKEVEMKDEL